MIEQLDENSCIVVTRMSRLSRSLSDLFDVMETIEAKGSDIVFLKENIDTTTSQGRLAFNLMACINSYTRELISESCREGRAAKEEDPNFEGWGRPDKWDKRKKSHRWIGSKSSLSILIHTLISPTLQNTQMIRDTPPSHLSSLP